MKTKTQNSKFYFIGGGIASLAGAVFLIRDGNISGEDITIFEADKKIGGSLDAQKLTAQKAYCMRGFRMFEKKVYSCTFDLFASIPSLKDPRKTIQTEFVEFNKKFKTRSKMRLLEKEKIINAKPFKMKLIDRINLLLLLIRSETSLENLRIKDYFTTAFFQSNFWFEFATTFSFQAWDSAIEIKRYLLRFLQDASELDDTECIYSAPYNQYDSIVLPILKWLKKQGLNFKTNCQVSDLDFEKIKNKKRVKNLTYLQRKKQKQITIGENDYVFITVGSIIANSSFGSARKAPRLCVKKNIAWKLWEKLAKQDSNFGRPSSFDQNIQKSKWVFFTLTLRDTTFLKLLENFTKEKAEGAGLITIKDSNWLLTIALPHQPYFLDQPKNINVCCGYGLTSDRKGNFVKKKMSDCSGIEIITELCRHLGFKKELTKILRTSTCIPCLLPYITSQFSPRKKSDRPKVIPKNSSNFACIGQYCEIPNGIVFTVEHSIQSAQMAVYGLLNLKKKITPIYKGQHHLKIIYRAIKTVFR
ncbi:oleate hydratase [Patescibacteria group bacterium]|nr:oleate hydratase [Patescibacteria group bacterium]